MKRIETVVVIQMPIDQVFAFVIEPLIDVLGAIDPADRSFEYGN